MKTWTKKIPTRLKNCSQCNRTKDISYLVLYLPSATVVAERLCFHRCLSVHRGEMYITPRQTPPLGRHPPEQTPPRQTPAPNMATAAGGMHPTGMLSSKSRGKYENSNIVGGLFSGNNLDARECTWVGPVFLSIISGHLKGGKPREQCKSNCMLAPPWKVGAPTSGNPGSATGIRLVNTMKWSTRPLELSDFCSTASAHPP